jgi:L-ascorbate metabolism protein UlaG (beta-lactamase superfamily)
VLSDPCFSDTVGFPRIINPYRRSPLKLTPEELPKIDVVICTHRHPDHFELTSLKRMDKNLTIFVPEKWMAKKLTRIGFEDIIQIKVWEERDIKGIKVAAVPAIEGSQGLPQVGYVIVGNDKGIYFGGDTMTFPEIEEIGKRFKIDVVLPPINGVRFLGRQADMTPEDAADAVIKMGAKMAIPQHYDLLFGFPLNLAYKAPGMPEDFVKAIKRKTNNVLVKTLGSGESIEI